MDATKAIKTLTELFMLVSDPRSAISGVREIRIRLISEMAVLTQNLHVVGPDPADPSRVLVRKLVQVNDKTWGYEEVTISKNADASQA